MNVIDFPKNRQIEIKQINSKFDATVDILRYLVENGADYHIVIDREYAEKIFDKCKRKYTVITSNADKAMKLVLEDENFNIYAVQGDELD